MQEAQNIYNIPVVDSYGRKTTLESYKGFVLLIVNVASKCGFAQKNYLQLSDLLENFYKKGCGLRVLLFPCNDFLGQEPGGIQEIRKMVNGYNEKFILFDKVKVLQLPGSQTPQHDLYKYLKENYNSSWITKIIKWNFTKFLISSDGKVLAKYGPNDNIKENDPVLLNALGSDKDDKKEQEL